MHPRPARKQARAGYYAMSHLASRPGSMKSARRCRSLLAGAAVAALCTGTQAGGWFARCEPVSRVGAAAGTAYKRQVACQIHASNSARLYDGAPPPMLRSVVVLSIRIDVEGKVLGAQVVRSNGHLDLNRIAIDSVRLASPLPRPHKASLRKGAAELMETWLFRDDGRFQLRSLAQVQSSGVR